MWQALEDDYLVFHPLSDEIHRLNPLAAAVLAELESGPLDLKQLNNRIDMLFGTANDHIGELEAQIGKLLEQFDELGLIATVAQPNTPTTDAA